MYFGALANVVTVICAGKMRPSPARRQTYGQERCLPRIGNRQILVHAQTWAGHSIWLRASTTALLILAASVSAGIAASVAMPISTSCGQTLRIVSASHS